MPQVGDTVLHYEILSELGKGGMGEVFKALDTRLDREVALKFLLNHDQADHEQKERLVIEAKAVAKLDHHNIAHIYTIEEHDDQLFLAMALYEGESLDELLSRGVLGVDKALELVKQILQGLSHAHAKGVIHRDIKPANIFITNEGVVKILDFGLARLPDSNLTHKGEMMGTPNYISPEQLKNDMVDHQADIWSLGVLLFQILTGELPFAGKFPQVMVSILKEDPKPLEQYINHPGLQAVIEQCLAKDKLERYQNCLALLTALQDLEQIAEAKAVPRATSRRKEPSFRRLPSLVGREGEVAELVSLLTDEDNYLISVTGMGGAGKTSLAQVVTADAKLERSYPDGIYFVPLEALQDASQVPNEIASMLGVQLRGQDVWQELGQVLQARICLIVLDNLEHLIENCAVELEELLNDCSNLTILATSREVLGIPGEVVFDLKGLAVPANLEADFLAYGATELFITLAKRFKRSFDLEVDKAHVLAICQQLEGWPLGIELVVAWIRQLSTAEIAEKLNSNLDLLTTRSRTHAARHQSARAAFEYSWELLTKAEQADLAKLSVFMGGFTTEAAREVCSVDLPALARLVDKSLLFITDQGRYDYHSLIHAFCREKLHEGDAAFIHDKHSLYFSELALQAKPALLGRDQVFWLNRLKEEYDNLLAALGWLESQGQIVSALRLAVALRRYWGVRGPFQQGCAWLRRLRTQLPLDDQLELKAVAFFVEGELTWVQDQQYQQAAACFEESLSLYRQLGVQLGIGMSLRYLGWMAFWQGEYEKAEQLTLESLSLLQQLGDSGDLTEVAWSSYQLATIAYARADYPAAKQHAEESLAFHQQLGNQGGVAWSIASLGDIARSQADFVTAKQHFEQSLLLLRELGDQYAIYKCLSDLGELAFKQADYVAAKQYLEEALTLNKSLGDNSRQLHNLTYIALLLSKLNKDKASVSLLSAIQALATQFEFDLESDVRSIMQENLNHLRIKLDEARFRTLCDEGQELSLYKAVELALSELRSLSV